MGVTFGLLAGAYLASRHSHRLKKLVEDEKRQAARAVRSAKDQLSTRLEEREHELAQHQSRLDDERRNVELGVSKLKADFAHLKTQSGALKSELQTTTEDAFRELAQFHDVATALQHVIEAVESRLLAADVRLRKLGITSGDRGQAGSPDGPVPETADQITKRTTMPASKP